jgi:hypothetical protein
MVKTAFTVLLMVSFLGIAACGDDDDEGGTATGTEEAETTGKEGTKPILIRTHVAPPNARGETVGEVRAGSTIGDSAFCAGGKFADAPRDPSVESVSRTFRCSDGTLTIKFTAGPDQALKQSGDWEVVKGLNGFEGLSGGGGMKAVFESDSDEGQESFTGSVTP